MATDAEKHVWEDEAGDLVVLLDLPGGPREYVIADVSATTGRWVTRLTDKTMEAQRRLDAGEDGEDIDADLHLSDEAEKDLYEELLGSTYDDMEADGVRWKKVQLVGQVAYAWVLRGLAGARKVWENGGEAPKANRAERRATSRASGSRTKTVGVSATTTKPRASTSRTKTRS
jgi:hypothetical protein